MGLLEEDRSMNKSEDRINNQLSLMEIEKIGIKIE